MKKLFLLCAIALTLTACGHHHHHLVLPPGHMPWHNPHFHPGHGWGRMPHFHK